MTAKHHYGYGDDVIQAALTDISAARDLLIGLADSLELSVSWNYIDKSASQGGFRSFGYALNAMITRLDGLRNILTMNTDQVLTHDQCAARDESIPFFLECVKETYMDNRQ